MKDLAMKGCLGLNSLQLTSNLRPCDLKLESLD